MNIKNLTLLSVVACLLFSASCQKDFKEKHDGGDEENLTSLVTKLGFDTLNMKVSGDTLWVEDDIVLFKSKLSQTSPRQAIANPPGSASVPNLILYYIAPQSALGGFNSSEEAAILAAIASYSSLTNSNGTTYLNFQRVYSLNQAHINFFGYSNQRDANLCGFAQWPTVNNRILNPGDVYINLAVTRGTTGTISPLSHSQLVFLVAHEMGHAFGVRHTNWRLLGEPQFEGSVGAYTVPFTDNSSPNPDPSSVFNGRTCGFYWNGFTAGDERAISWSTQASILIQ
ncbi:zinc-dependent metalloprotease family protein [Sphingobacterium chungjuense]|uniref:zinc-dependent metalloprotease family protein n=1 Tax=Sphingobacterium chungjuense TaxID=2675553 RepID=UPI001409BE8E|nr:zinc-dependent metalloprotease family protein [Sphingobacterium chungjuense]